MSAFEYGYLQSEHAGQMSFERCTVCKIIAELFLAIFGCRGTYRHGGRGLGRFRLRPAFGDLMFRLYFKFYKLSFHRPARPERARVWQRIETRNAMLQASVQ